MRDFNLALPLGRTTFLRASSFEHFLAARIPMLRASFGIQQRRTGDEVNFDSPFDG